MSTEEPDEANVNEAVPEVTATEPAESAEAAESTESAEPVKGKPAPVKPKEPRIPPPSSLQEIVGALLFAAETPLTASDLRACVRGVEPEAEEDAEIMDVYRSCTAREIDEALHGLEKDLERAGSGFRLVCTAGAYRLQTAPQCGRYVRALLKLDRPSRLSRASLETLAIVAYRQPIAKAEIEEVRGVGVDTILKTLVDLGLVRLVGRSELPGHPFLYGTSPFFLEHFGLASLDQLNEIDPTLQRANPRLRAAAYKRPAAEQTELELAAAEAKSGAKDGAKPKEEKAAEVEKTANDASVDNTQDEKQEEGGDDAS